MSEGENSHLEASLAQTPTLSKRLLLSTTNHGMKGSDCDQYTRIFHEMSILPFITG